MGNMPMLRLAMHDGAGTIGMGELTPADLLPESEGGHPQNEGRRNSRGAEVVGLAQQARSGNRPPISHMSTTISTKTPIGAAANR
jgi:hypothetical protein